MQLLVNLDVPDLDQGIVFYTQAFELELKRRIGGAVAELAADDGLRVYLLAKKSGTKATTTDGARAAGATAAGATAAGATAAGASAAGAATDGPTRDYGRHWTPVHLDVVVKDLDAALERAVAAGARVEQAAKSHSWGRIAMLADPFGHGFCLIQLLNRGYDELPWEHP